jgi:ATP-dependent DNA helicase RecG
LAEEIFPDLRVGLLHGRLPSDEKLQALTAFQSGSISILVCTTVIEVGIDVPNATLIVVENAERFGLAQLHQLRGRVGRGAEPGECILLTDKDAGEEAAGRLQILCETNDGFRIAEEDLLRRGPGDLAGLRQSGLADFRFINLTRDQRIIERARCEARKFIDTRECGEESERERIIAHVRRMWEDRKPLLEAG